MIFIDARLPIRFGPLSDRGEAEAVLTDGAAPIVPPMARFTVGEAGHTADCLCCVPRGGAATALSQLFRERAVTSGPAFRGVLAVVEPAGEAAVRKALAADALVAGRFRLG